MSGGQEKNFSTLGPKLRESKAQQDHGDKQRQIRIEVIDYIEQGFEGDPYECCQRVATHEAILITGGYDAKQSAEIFLPWQNSTCELPALPDERASHVQSGKMLCGGEYTRRSCVQWSVQQGGWVTLPLNLPKGERTPASRE